jgi:hypothetical protein
VAGKRVLAAHALRKRAAAHVLPFFRCANIVSRRESTSNRTQDNHAHVVVGIGCGECMIHLLDHQAGLRIFVARTVSDHFGDSAVLFVQYCLVFHR